MGLKKCNGKGQCSTIPPKPGTKKVIFGKTTFVGKACKKVYYMLGKADRNEKDKSSGLSHHRVGSTKTR